MDDYMDCLEPRQDRPVFVFGSPRSGTSLVSRLLNAHPRIGIPLESLLYDTFWPIRHRYGDLRAAGNAERLLRHMLRWSPVAAWRPPVSYPVALNKIDHRDFHGVFRAIVTAWSADQGKAVWGEKSPWHAFYWREILEAFPLARIVHVVRDPRDATLSWKKARQGPRNAWVLARRWSGYMAIMDEVRAGWPSSAFHELRYEDLLTDPEGQCAQICRFLNEVPDPAMLKFHHAGERYNTDMTNRANLARPIMRENTGKWTSELSQNEIRWIESVAGQHMDHFGYDRQLPAANVLAHERLWIKTIANPASRILGMLKDRQGQKEALEKRLFPIAARLRLG